MSAHYSNAPIIEAIIDLRVSLPESTSIDVFTRLKETLLSSFPIENDMRVETAVFTPNEFPSTTSEHIGFRLMSEDKQKVVVVTLQGFTFSHLAPYDNWEMFRDEAREQWNNYKSACFPTSITRTAVRYINRLDLPFKSKINTYVSLYPAVPNYPHRETQGFFMQLQIPQPDIESMLIINEAKVEPLNPNAVSLMLDIDLFRNNIWDANNDDAAWTFLESLRRRKNEIFESSITQKTKELIL